MCVIETVCLCPQVFAYPLQKEGAGLVALPLSAPLKVLRSRNEEALRALPEFARVADKCTRLLAEAQDRIQVLDAKAAPPLSPTSTPDAGRTWRGVPFLRRSASSDAANLLASPRLAHLGHQDENRAPASGGLATAASSPRLGGPASSPDEYDEIDQIYDYVRGFAPLPKSAAVVARSASPPSPSSAPASSPRATPPAGTAAPGPPGRPEPPPIETIPTKKVSRPLHQQYACRPC